MPTAVAVRHVHFEGLGSLEPLLRERGYAVRYLEAGRDPIEGAAARDADLLVVLGAPIGANDHARYPFLREEYAVLEARLRTARPTLGICLGAQLLARTLGARVYPNDVKEIGWAPVELTAAGRDSPLAALGGPVLHWHGDTFDLPEGARWLARTAACAHQAFALGSHVLALQFHLEVRAEDLESWLIGHCVELAAAGVDPGALRDGARRHGPTLEHHAREVFGRWLDELPHAAARGRSA